MDFVAIALPSAAFRPPPSLVDDANDADHSESDFVDCVGSSTEARSHSMMERRTCSFMRHHHVYTSPCHLPGQSYRTQLLTRPRTVLAAVASLGAYHRLFIPGAETSISTLTPSVRSRNLVYRVGLARVPITGSPISRVARHSRHKSSMGPGISPWSSRKLCCAMATAAVQDESEGEQEDEAEQGLFSQAMFMANQVPVVSPASADATSSGFVA
ncbi:hypothetical protein B0H17DRAFT_1146135 [Mycena rosella]|uniref:Uncharacterized protein n=1 Tax=Mycena rosella TaxID=1033263 RepID=A0AAD7CPK5_MYCRO|nr:hypothetical protein B0H17DRAFT_1146135 [Mycena rosella]